MSEELERCPFCGSNNLDLIRHDYIGDTEYLHHSIDCDGCPVSMEVGGDKELIVAAWNTRINPLL